MDPCGLGEKLRDIVLNVIWEHFLYLICYGQNVEKLNEELVRLTIERRSIQDRIDEARNNVKQIDEKVLYWLDEVNGISKQAEQLHKESRSKRECTITSCPNPWLRYKLSKRAKAMAQQVVDINGRANFPIVAIRVPPPPMPELPTVVNNEGIDSRVRIKSQIIEALRDPSVKMVGLCGLGGVGKTTIAKDVTKEEEIQKMFKKVIMATVSQEKNIGNVQDQIIDNLGMQLNERTEEVKAFRLCERLKEEKNMLLILDDVWAELDLGKVGVPFVDVEKYGKNNEGCKILFTSRNEELLSNRMKCQEIINVGILSKDEAWELFKRIVEVPIDSSMASIATEIVQKCGGLPLAIATAAKALKEKKGMHGWKDYIIRLKRLKRSSTGIREVDTILRLSYDDLSEEDQKIFLLAAMMSHDPSIEDLLMYSMGLDILEHVETMAHARDVIFDVVRKLKLRNLFLDSFSMHRFTIHDVYRDLALSIASDEFKAIIVRHRGSNEWTDEDKLEHCRSICLQESYISDLPEVLHSPMLELFLLDSNKLDLAIPDMFFKSSKKLKLLAFTNMPFLSLTPLRFLEKLKALCLHSCVLADITEVGRLRKLKVLSLAYSEIEHLPIELKNLTSLQMLNLSYCSNLRVIPQKLLSSFEKLEVLYMEESFHQWNDEQSIEANENTSLDELRGLPISYLDIHIPNAFVLPDDLFLRMKLERYKILIGKHWQWWQINDETSKILRLEIEGSIHLKAGIRKLMEGVEDLYLYGSNGHENVLYSHYERGIPSLKHLHIESNEDIKHIFLTSAHQEAAFPILESLELINLKSLENLCEGPNAIEFRELHTLKMENLLALKDRATNNVSKSLFNKVLFPKLEILQLSSLNSLIELIWDDQLSHNSFSNLKKLIVERCGIVKLVPFHVLKSLNNLDVLEVGDCDMLETVFDFENLNDNEEIESSSVVVPLKELKLWSLPKLKNVWSNHYCQVNVSFPSLRSVNIRSCESLTSIFPASIAKDMLRDLEFPTLTALRLAHLSFDSLTMLKVSKCHQLACLMTNSTAKSMLNLETLKIEGCEKLEEIVAEETNDSMLPPSFQKLKFFRVKSCSLIKLAPASASFDSLTMLEVSECHQLACLMTYSTAKSMVNLETLEIVDCAKLEEIVRKTTKEDVEGEIVFHGLRTLKLTHLPKLKTTGDRKDFNTEDRVANTGCTNISTSLFNLNKVLLPKLEILKLSNLSNNLISLIWDDQLLHNSFSNLKTLIVERCISLESVPLRVLKSLNNLKRLKVSNCDKLEKVFGYEDLNDYYKVKESSSVVVPSNLTHLEVKLCNGLTTLMTSSTARSLVHLTHLSVRRCDQIEEIIRKEEGGDDEDKAILFTEMEFLELHDLHRLERFCGYNYTFKFPLLEHVTITKCPQLTMFCLGDIHAPCLHSIRVTQFEPHKDIWKTNLNNTVQHLFTFEEVISTTWSMVLNAKNITTVIDVFPEVKGLYVESFKDEGVTFPYRSLERFPKMDWLYVEHSSFEEIFPSQEKIIAFKGKIPSFTQLYIAYLDKLKSIWKDDSQLPPIHQNLHYLQVKSCCNLTKLAPSSASFENLMGLYISGCHHLIHLVTISTAKSLVILDWLEIHDCKKMEEIVMNDTNEDVDRAITFTELREIELTEMPSLKTFSSQNHSFEFPELEEIKITGCPKIKMLCPGVLEMPKMPKVKIEEHDIKWEDERDLNKIIQQLSSEKDSVNM